MRQGARWGRGRERGREGHTHAPENNVLLSRSALDGGRDTNVDEMVASSEPYADQVLDDHGLFVGVFRDHRLLGR